MLYDYIRGLSPRGYFQMLLLYNFSYNFPRCNWHFLIPSELWVRWHIFHLAVKNSVDDLEKYIKIENSTPTSRGEFGSMRRSSLGCSFSTHSSFILLTTLNQCQRLAMPTVPSQLPLDPLRVTLVWKIPCNQTRCCISSE